MLTKNKVLAAMTLLALVIGVMVPLNAQTPESTPEAVMPEAGTVRMTFRKADTAMAQIRFQRVYKKAPVVVVSESNSSGNWLILKTEQVSAKGCIVVGREFEEKNINYSANIAYIVIEPSVKAGKR